MDIDSLRSFLAFVETGSFTRAAQQMCRTQSAISMQMKKLESELNQKLFIKDGRMVSLTREGGQLVSYARQLVELHDETLNRCQSKIKTLRVGCPDDYAKSILAPLIGLLQEMSSDIEVIITANNSAELHRLFDLGELDLAIISRSPESDEGYFIVQTQGVWIGDEALLKEPILPLALFEVDCRFRKAAVSGLEKRKVSHKLISESKSAAMILAQIDAGFAITAMATHSVGSRPRIDSLPSLPTCDIALLINSTANFYSHIIEQLKLRIS